MDWTCFGYGARDCMVSGCGKCGDKRILINFSGLIERRDGR